MPGRVSKEVRCHSHTARANVWLDNHHLKNQHYWFPSLSDYRTGRTGMRGHTYIPLHIWSGWGTICGPVGLSMWPQRFSPSNTLHQPSFTLFYYFCLAGLYSWTLIMPLACQHGGQRGVCGEINPQVTFTFIALPSFAPDHTCHWHVALERLPSGWKTPLPPCI